MEKKDRKPDGGGATSSRRGGASASRRSDPLGRTVICACEKVTALEIHNALRGALPARSISGVAKRTRATWGRCHMLTRDDETVADARSLYEQVAETPVTHVGCKDVGLPRKELEALLSDIRANGHTSYLEVVSDTREGTLESARVASELTPDYLIGGTLVEPVREILGDSPVRFFPHIGRVVGHPCRLRGSVEEIAADARRKEQAEVDGINLLAYRYDGDVRALVSAVSAATTLPLICAGSVDSPGRVRELASLGVWAFTIGTAVLERRIVEDAPLSAQIEAVLEAVVDAVGGT